MYQIIVWIFMGVVYLTMLFSANISILIVENSLQFMSLMISVNFATYLYQAFSKKRPAYVRGSTVLAGIASSANLLPCLSLLVLEAISARGAFRGTGILGLIFVPIGIAALLVVLLLVLLVGEGIPAYLSHYAEDKESVSSSIMAVIGLVLSILITFWFVKMFAEGNFSDEVWLLGYTAFAKYL